MRVGLNNHRANIDQCSSPAYSRLQGNDTPATPRSGSATARPEALGTGFNFGTPGVSPTQPVERAAAVKHLVDPFLALFDEWSSTRWRRAAGSSIAAQARRRDCSRSTGG